MSLVVRNFSQFDNSESENDEVLQKSMVKERKQHKYIKVATCRTIEAAKKELKEKGFSYNYQVKANASTQREVKSLKIAKMQYKLFFRLNSENFFLTFSMF